MDIESLRLGGLPATELPPRSEVDYIGPYEYGIDGPAPVITKCPDCELEFVGVNYFEAHREREHS